MFGKKKDAAAQAKRDFHCAICGLDCKDQNILERHVSWAHKESAVPGKVEGNKT